jgi:hypothetical protein
MGNENFLILGLGHNVFESSTEHGMKFTVHLKHNIVMGGVNIRLQQTLFFKSVNVRRLRRTPPSDNAV